jgi:hypothetical protein
MVGIAVLGQASDSLRTFVRSQGNAFNSNQGHPGQDLLWPGEFVLGYNTQIPKIAPDGTSPNPTLGPISTSAPSWTSNGSYLVFRRCSRTCRRKAGIHGEAKKLTPRPSTTRRRIPEQMTKARSCFGAE